MAKMKKTCSFCGRSDTEVAMMITGLNACICNECAERAQQIVAEELKKKQTTSTPSVSSLYRYTTTTSDWYSEIRPMMSR